MQVKLKVLQGSSAGREIKVKEPRFVVGRHEECQLRPKTDAISRRHCEIIVGEKQAIVHDLGSKNGTWVNDERIEGDHVLKTGDRLRIARIEFEVLLEGQAHAAAAPESTEPSSDGGGSGSMDDLIGDWLTESEGPNGHTGDTDTRQFRLDETDQIALERATQDELEKEAEAAKSKGDKKKREPGKLPKRQLSGENTQEAAHDMLKRYFNRQ